MVRNISIEVRAPSLDTKKVVVRSVRHYRAVCRQVYAAAAMAEMAGAEYLVSEDDIKVRPRTDEARQILAAAMGYDGKAHVYQCRDWVLKDLAPTWLSFVWDGLRRDVSSRWRAPDPQFPQARRGWLTLQGGRDMARFQRVGIALPAATARPKLVGHTLTLKWDRDIGPITFHINRGDHKLDAGRYYVWRNLREKVAGWKLGTLYLTERDGRLFATISFEKPGQESVVDPDRTMEVRIGGDDPETYIRLSGPDGPRSYDTISVAEAIAWLDGLAAQRAAREARRRAVGSPRKSWGNRTMYKAAQAQVNRITQRRTNGSQSRNHLWTRRITIRAQQWRCGRVSIVEVPDNLMGRSWGWSTFEQYLKYKVEEIGGVVVK